MEQNEISIQEELANGARHVPVKRTAKTSAVSEKDLKIQDITLDLLRAEVTTCQVTYDDDPKSTPLTYLYPRELGAEIGELVLVQAPANSKSGFPRVARLVWIDPEPQLQLCFLCKWVLSSVSLGAQDLIQKQQSVIDHIKTQMAVKDTQGLYAELGLDRDEFLASLDKTSNVKTIKGDGYNPSNPLSPLHHGYMNEDTRGCTSSTASSSYSWSCSDSSSSSCD